MFTSRFSHLFSRTSTTSLWKKYFVAYYSSETEKVRPAFVAVCTEHCSKQSHFPVWKLQFLFFILVYFTFFPNEDSSSNIIKVFDAMVLTERAHFCVNVLQFKTIPLLCRGADFLAGELPVQSFVTLRKRNNLCFWLGFTGNQVFLSTWCWTWNSKDVDYSFQFCSIPPMWHWPVPFPCWALPLKMKWSVLSLSPFQSKS